LNRNRVTTLL